jgi:hypothetical protein
MKYLKMILLSTGFILIITLYFNNNANKTLLGIILDSFWLTWLAVFYILLLHLTCEISLPERFHAICKIEKSGKIYRYLGVKNFKDLLTKNPFPTFTAKISLRDFSTAGLHKLEKDMRNAEAIHFLGFLTSLLIMILFGFFRDFRFFYFMIIFTIIINLYPVLVQRYNRNRIHKILNA